MLFQNAFAVGAKIGTSIKEIVKVELIESVASVDQIWKEMLGNNVSGRRGIMASLNIDRDLKAG